MTIMKKHLIISTSKEIEEKLSLLESQLPYTPSRTALLRTLITQGIQIAEDQDKLSASIKDVYKHE